LNLDDRYLIWQLVQTRRAYAVIRFDNEFLRGQLGSLAGTWPEAAFCVVDAAKGPGDLLLPDCLWNTDHRLFISSRLKDFLSRQALPDVEFWPIKVIDPTGRPVGQPYFFLHLFNGPDCLDLAASGATRSRILPEKAEKLERLLFVSDPERPLFRPKTFAQITLVQWSLAKAIAQQKFSGFRFMGLFDYGLKGDLPPHPERYKVDALIR